MKTNEFDWKDVISWILLILIAIVMIIWLIRGG